MSATGCHKGDIMNTTKELRPVAWWRYPAAIVGFFFCYFILSIIISFIWGFLNLLSPAFYRSSSEWITIIADATAVYIGFSLVDNLLLNSKYVFQAVFAAIVAIISLFFAFFSVAFVATASVNWISVIGFVIAAIIAIVFVGVSCKKHAEEIVKKKSAETIKDPIIEKYIRSE